MNKKYMVIDGAHVKRVVHSLLPYIGENYSLNDSEFKSSEAKHSSPCSCACSELSADIEGLKLDLAIVEAAGQQNKVRISEINQEIRAKLNYPVHQYKGGFPFCFFCRARDFSIV